MVLFFVLEKQEVLELVLSDLGGFEDHREGLDKCAVIVDNLDADKGFEHLGEV